MKRIIISSNCSGGGKTTVTLGIMKALTKRGLKVQGYKVGPDYIDKEFHKLATGIDSRNLDMFLMGKSGVSYSLSKGCGDISIIEGVMGLYDGKGLDEEFSTYHLSKEFNHIPIILVMTPKAQSLTICAEINGIKNFKGANIKGVIFNKVSEKYYNLLKELVNKNCDVDVLGYIPKDESISLKSRHLGLVQSIETEKISEVLDKCSDLVNKYIKLEKIIDYAKDISIENKKLEIKKRDIKIAVAYDKAFNFYYKENLEILESIGEVVYFSPLNDKELPKDIDFLYIGGGYPEVFKNELSNNKSMLKSIRESLNKGLKCYAECGGFMYLNKSIEGFDMVNFFNSEVVMTNSLQNFGYAVLKGFKNDINIHEFHKSKCIGNRENIFDIEKTDVLGNKINWKCGYKKNNTIAQYPHIHFYKNLDFLDNILDLEGEK